MAYKGVIKRGDVIIVALPNVGGSVQSGTRACVVVQNDVGNHYAPTIEVVAFTKVIKNAHQPTHGIVRKSALNGLELDSMLLCEQIITVPKTAVHKRLGQLNCSDTNVLNDCLLASLGLLK